MTSTPGPVRAGECRVWWAEEAAAAAHHDALLSPVERHRRDRYRQPVDRRRFTVGVALSRLLLAAATGTSPDRLAIDRHCAGCGEPHGRPRLADGGGGLDFNVSHSGGRVVVAITTGVRVGVDVEHAGPRSAVTGVERLVLSAEERRHLDRRVDLDRSRAVLRYWTRKEAVVKATGDGLGAGMDRLTMSAPDEAPRLLSWRDREEICARIAVWDLHGPADHPAALAVLRPDGSPPAVPVTVSEHDATVLLAANG
nr:4'-phosphopantetheinyl transferase [uncultured bacterium]